MYVVADVLLNVALLTAKVLVLLTRRGVFLLYLDAFQEKQTLL